MKLGEEEYQVNKINSSISFEYWHRNCCRSYACVCIRYWWSPVLCKERLRILQYTTDMVTYSRLF